MGAMKKDHTPWLVYFVETMANAASELQAKARKLTRAGAPEVPPWERLPRTSQQLLTRLLARVLDGLENPFVVNSSDIDSWFGVSERTAREWLKQWAEEGFVNPVTTGSGERVRSYILASEWIETCFKMTAS